MCVCVCVCVCVYACMYNPTGSKPFLSPNITALKL